MRQFEHGGNVYEARKRLDKKSIIDYSANINALGMSENGIDAYYDALAGVRDYPDPHCTALCETIAEVYQVEKEVVVPGNGAIELMHRVALALMLSDIVIVGPTFVEYERAFKNAQTTCHFYLSTAETAYHSNLESVFQFAIEKQAKAIVLCNPNNPIGNLYDRDDVLELLRKCADTGIWLLYDEAFMDFAKEAASLMNQIVTHDQLVVFRSFTKFYAIPGLRCGCLMTSNEPLRQKLKAYEIPWGINQVAQDVTVASLRDRHYYERTNAYFDDESDRIYHAYNQLDSLIVYQPTANYLYFEEKNSTHGALVEFLENKGMLIRHCNNYVGLGVNGYRLAIKKRQENDVLFEAIKEYYAHE